MLYCLLIFHLNKWNFRDNSETSCRVYSVPVPIPHISRIAALFSGGASIKLAFIFKCVCVCLCCAVCVTTPHVVLLWHNSRIRHMIFGRFKVVETYTQLICMCCAKLTVEKLLTITKYTKPFYTNCAINIKERREMLYLEYVSWHTN